MLRVHRENMTNRTTVTYETATVKWNGFIPVVALLEEAQPHSGAA